MISQAQAEALDYALRERGMGWQPADGDRFVIPGRDLDRVFVVADMVVEVTELASGPLISFNGTTEWALDSIAAREVLWLPWEHQLRGLLGSAFAALESTGESFVVHLRDGSQHRAEDAEQAYVLALLSAT